MAKRMKAEIYSVFGQIEGVIADAMTVEGKAKRIERSQIPPSALVSERGRIAHCALIMNRQEAAEFDRRVADLYA